jgi:hypothetical protein
MPNDHHGKARRHFLRELALATVLVLLLTVSAI